MGQSESLPALEEDQLEVSYQEQGLSELPVFVRDGHPVVSIDAAGNCLRKFPLALPSLRYLDMSKNKLSEINWSQLVIHYDTLESLRLSDNNLSFIPAPVRAMKTLKTLALDKNELGRTELDLTEFPNLESVDLFLNFFTDFPKLPDTVMVLNIGFNQIRNIDLHTPRLKDLRLSGNEITEFAPDFVFESLEVLDLSMNRLVELPPIVSFAPRLVELKCPHNFLGVVPVQLPLCMKKLDLSHNCMRELGEEIGDLPNLEVLNISFNRLTHLPKLPMSLLHFNAERNQIARSVPLTVTQLNTLQLNHNVLERIPDIKGSRAAVLMMRNNKLKRINATDVSKMTKRIDLTNNQIEEIPSALCKFVAIQSWNFSMNRISSIPMEVSSVRLTSLFLSETNISDLPELPHTLLSIVCIGCRFTRLPASIFAVPRLGVVDFSCNKISEIEKFPDVHSVNLSMNKIRTMPPLPENMVKLDLSVNKITEVNITGEFLLLQELDLSHNRIKKFRTCTLTVLHQLKLAGNPIKGKMPFSKIPVIRTLDVTCTKLRFVGDMPTDLREYCTHRAKLAEKYKGRALRIYSAKGVGYSEVIGTRPSMEDALIVYKNFAPDVHIYSVIDGHGGAETSSTAANLIPHYFGKLKRKAIAEITPVLKRVNQHLLERNVKDGAAIVFCVVTETEIGCAHLGDSRALIVKRGGNVVPLTCDHKPTERSEIDLVKENRSFVDSNRIAGILSVSRAIGDFNIPGVSHVPDMTSYRRQPDDMRLVLGCDGVFDVIENEDVGHIVAGEQDPIRAAYLLRNLATARGSQDNISVIVVDISRR